MFLGLLSAGLLPDAAGAQAPAGHITGRPLSVVTNGLGQIQVRANEDPRGSFRQRGYAQEALPSEVGDAGLAFMIGEVYYPAGGLSEYQPVGQRTAVSAPAMTIDGAGARTLRSVYDIADQLRVTETVSYVDGASEATFEYLIRNISGAPLAQVRAAQLARLSGPASGAGAGQTVTATGVAGGQLTLTNLGDTWSAWQMGREFANTDVYTAFTAGGLEDGRLEGALANTQLGAEWRYGTLGPDDTRTIKVSWRVNAPPASVTVTTTSDHAPDGCTPNDCTLREALAVAADEAVIALGPGTYQLADELTVTKYRVIRGGGARQTTIKAAPGRRHFVVDLPDGALGLTGVTLTGGAAMDTTTGQQTGYGGSIYTRGPLALTDSSVTQNSALVAGGIFAFGSSLSITRSTISGNRAVKRGESSSEGTVGGVYAFYSAVEIANSTLSGNTAQNLVGGFATLGVGTIVNTTITDNTGTDFAGLYSVGIDESGDGQPADAPSVSVHGSIVAGNHGPRQCQPMPTVASNNIAGDTSCQFNGAGNRVLADPQLGALANNGGPTDTHLPLAGSPAIDGGGVPCALGDQRGVARPFGAACDVGAVESGGSTPPVPEDPAPDVPQAGGASVQPTPQPTPTPTPLPPPQTGKSVNAEVKAGKVLIKPPGSKRYVELKAGQQIPVGTTLDTRKGRVTLSSRGAGGKVETAEFYAGIFKVTQTRGAKPITVLTLVEKLSCPKRGRAAAAAGKKKRRLWGNGKGAFRTVGSYSAATVRGTTWLTEDTCTSTLTRVTQGAVTVLDKVKRKTVVVRKGKRYVARARAR